MNSSSRRGPPNVQPVTFVTGNSTTASREPVRSEPLDRTTAVQRDPDAALGVDDETVRVPVDPREDAPPGQPRVDVVVEDVGPTGRRVVVVRL